MFRVLNILESARDFRFVFDVEVENNDKNLVKN